MSEPTRAKNGFVIIVLGVAAYAACRLGGTTTADAITTEPVASDATLATEGAR